MLAFLKCFFWQLRHYWLPQGMLARIRPLRFSVCTEERIPDCVDLFARNAAHGVPCRHLDHYEQTLRERSVLTFVAEDADGVVGTFGLQIGFQPQVVWVCYVLVHPEQHRQGIGSTLMLAALALLPPERGPLSVAVSALPTALRFYERLGFRRAGETPFDDGEMHPLAVFSPMTPAMSRQCRKILLSAGATLPERLLAIPTAKLPAAEMADAFPEPV